MRILMMTNTYRPIIGGLERSIEYFSHEYRVMGHEVLIVAPEQQGSPAHEKGVFRIPAIKNVNKTNFSIELPIYFKLSKVINTFNPDIVHAHHPFLVGNTALRIASQCTIPVIFTHHSLYEENTHYVPLNSSLMKRFLIAMATRYANACDYVFAPSESIAALIKQRGVNRPIEVIPTGIYPDHFKVNNAAALRKRLGINPDVFVIGTAGRLAPEKNIDFLMRGIMRFLQINETAVFLVVGQGILETAIKEFFQHHRVSNRLFCAGTLHGQDLIDAYHAMDIFTFASHSETQGLVILESMAAGIPVVAVDAPGVRDIARDKYNGFLIAQDNEQDFANAIAKYFSMSGIERSELCHAAKATATAFTMPRSAERAISIYKQLITDAKSKCKSYRWKDLFKQTLSNDHEIKSFAKATTDEKPNKPKSKYEFLEPLFWPD